MKVYELNQQNTQEAINILNQHGVAILPTDTIYGIHAKALSQEVVERVYQLKSRDEQKPFIIIISSLNDLKLFNVFIAPQVKTFLEKIWPNPISVILPCSDEKFSYLHRDLKSLAFRFPNNQFLLEVLKQTGPLISTSANLSGQPPATSINQVTQNFGDQIDIYIDQGELAGVSSTVLKISDDNQLQVLREGQIKLSDLPTL